MSASIGAGHVVDALMMALVRQRASMGLVVHSYRDKPLRRCRLSREARVIALVHSRPRVFDGNLYSEAELS